MIKLTLKDGSIKEIEQGSTIYEVAQKISEGLARVATCGIVNGEVKDLRYELQEDCNLSIETFDSSIEGKQALKMDFTMILMWKNHLQMMTKLK